MDLFDLFLFVFVFAVYDISNLGRWSCVREKWGSNVQFHEDLRCFNGRSGEVRWIRTYLDISKHVDKTHILGNMDLVFQQDMPLDRTIAVSFMLIREGGDHYATGGENVANYFFGVLQGASLHIRTKEMYR